MTNRGGMRSPARWAMLCALADASEPLSRRQLAEYAGTTTQGVIDAMKRPTRAGWVTFTVAEKGRRRHLYQITTVGRQQLAEYTKES